MSLKRSIAMRIARLLNPPRPKIEKMTENADGSVTVKSEYGSLAEAKRATSFNRLWRNPVGRRVIQWVVRAGMEEG